MIKKPLVVLFFLFFHAFAYRVADYGAVRVLYQPGQEALAEAVGKRALVALSTLIPPFEKPSSPLVLRLDPETDFFNGYASVFPRPGTTLFPAFPYYQGAFLNTADPLYTLVLHELVHLLHLKGPKTPLRLLYGKIPHPFPAWLTEGLATYFESQGGGGRLHDAYTEGLLRALAEDPPSLAEAGAAFYPRFPYGDLRYRVGVAFVDFLIRRHGLGVLLESFTRYQTRNRFAPFPESYASSWKKVAGTSLQNEWRAFWKSRPSVPIPPSPKGPPGHSPAVFGGKLAYLHEDAIVVGNRHFSHPLGRTVGRLAWLDEKTLVFDRLTPAENGGYARRLFTLNVETGRETPVPGAIHAYYPTAHRGTIYYIEESSSGSQLVALKAGQKKTLYQAGPGRHLVGVAASDWGLAVLVWERGRVFPVVIGKTPKILKAPGRILKDLAWWQEYLIFASDAHGVYEIYALDPASGKAYKLIAHPYGAFAPAQKGKALLFTVLTPQGFALDEAEPSMQEVAPQTAPPLSAPKLFPTEAQVRNYRPLASLGPVGWFPMAPLGAFLLGEDEANEITWYLATNFDYHSVVGFFLVQYTPRFGLAPEQYSLSLTNLGDRIAGFFGYGRSFLQEKTPGRFRLDTGIVQKQPFFYAALDLQNTRSFGRDRVWGEASQGQFLHLEGGYFQGIFGLVRYRNLFSSGLDVGLLLGQNANDPWLGNGRRAAAWLGFRRNQIADSYSSDGFYYFSHLTVEPKIGFLLGPKEQTSWGLEASLTAHFVYNYYFALTPTLRLGYRSDTGPWIQLSF